MGRPNGAARAEVEGDKCAGSGDPIGSGNESPVPGWKPHGSVRTESHRWLGFRGPRSGSSHSRAAVVSSGSSFVGISARLSAVGLGVFTIRKKKEKRTREESIFAILQIEKPDETNTGEVLKSPTAEGNKLRNPLESAYNA